MNKYLKIYRDSLGRKVFKYSFPSITSLVQYLKDTPVNMKVFGGYICSEIDTEPEFRGEPLKDTLEHLIYGYNQDYKHYREISKVSDIRFSQGIGEIPPRSIRSYVGSRVDIPSYVYGSPRNMRRVVRVGQKKIINFYFQLSYPAGTKETEIINRGIIAMQLIKALENVGYSINLIGFELDSESLRDDKEIFYVTINLKDADLTLNESKCIGPFMRKEFLRRILFRLLETADVSDYWSVSYGSTLPVKEAVGIMNLRDEDIIFGSPKELGIKGSDIYTDFETTIDKLKLNNEITLRKRLK